MKKRKKGKMAKKLNRAYIYFHVNNSQEAVRFKLDVDFGLSLKLFAVMLISESDTLRKHSYLKTTKKRLQKVSGNFFVVTSLVTDGETLKVNAENLDHENGTTKEKFKNLSI